MHAQLHSALRAALAHFVGSVSALEAEAGQHAGHQADEDDNGAANGADGELAEAAGAKHSSAGASLRNMRGVGCSVLDGRVINPHGGLLCHTLQWEQL